MWARGIAIQTYVMYESVIIQLIHMPCFFAQNFMQYKYKTSSTGMESCRTSLHGSRERTGPVAIIIHFYCHIISDCMTHMYTYICIFLNEGIVLHCMDNISM